MDIGELLEAEKKKEQAPRLIICGAGHVAKALLKVVADLNFECWVLDDREEMSREAEALGAKMALSGDYGKLLSELDQRAGDYFVCLTRGHYYDMACLRNILQRDFAYVGLMASRSRAMHTIEALRKEGIAEEQLKKLHAPIGLSIQAESPTEIAISIAGELILAQKESGQIYSDLQIQNRLEELSKVQDCQAVFCTIVDKHGSAPRKVGTRMLVEADGRVTGTIGGGIVEAKVLEKCRNLENDREVHSYSVMNSEAVDDGMLCGGAMTVEFLRIVGKREEV